MLGYLFVVGALAAGVTKGYCGKKTSGLIQGTRATFWFNAVRMLLCIPIGFLFVLSAGDLSALSVDWLTLLISAVSGISTAMFVVTWIGCVRWGAYMMVDVFITLGTVIPMTLCMVLFGETVGVFQIIGLLLLVFAAYLMCTYHKKLSEGSRLRVGQCLLLVLCGASNGLTQFSQKWLRYAGNTDVSVFNFYTYIVAALVLVLCALLYREPGAGGESADKRVNLRRLGLYVVIMSGCLFLHSFCSTAAAGYLPSSRLYPLMQGSSLVLSMLMSAVCFGERITVRCVIGISVTFAALLCINLL